MTLSRSANTELVLTNSEAHTTKAQDTMIGECWNCKQTTTVESHHAIHGRGKRKQLERPEGKYNLCVSCHRGTLGVHGRDGHALDVKIKKDYQSKLFAQGMTEDEVRYWMGGKLMLDDDGEIYK